jgi:hypothetical protein
MNKVFKRIGNIPLGILISISALLVSICAIFISVQEIRIMRTQQSANMYPYVTVGKTYNGKGFGIEVENSGNGLARIDSYKIHLEDNYFEDWSDILSSLAPEAKNIDYSLISTAGNIRNKMISPGETKNLIFLKWTPETRILEKRFRYLKVEICYSPLLGEHWTITNEIPLKIMDKCNIVPSEEFNP